VWASRQTILHELQVMEGRRDPGDGMKWSLATVKRSIARLEASGIVRRHRIRHEGLKKWGTRERTLHPERLLPYSECEPSIRLNVSRRSLESEPLEVKDFETSDSRANSHHPNLNQKHDDDSHSPGKDFSKPTPKNQKPKTYRERLARLKATAKAEILQLDAKDCRLRCGDRLITQITPEVVDSILDDVISKADYGGTVIGSAAYLVISYRNFMEADDLIDQHEATIIATPMPTNAAGPRGVSAEYECLVRPEFREPLVSEPEDSERDRQLEEKKFAALFADLTRRGDAYRASIGM
jgi:hypothetical protein